MTSTKSSKEENEQWEVVQEESATGYSFENIGDQLIGVYLGAETISPEGGEPFTRYLVRGTDGITYALNGYSLARGIQKATVNDMVRITYVKDIPTGKGNPLKDFRVERRHRK